jgi:hypothetical protein
MCRLKRIQAPPRGVIGSFDTDLSDGFIACVRVATARRIAGGLGVPSCSDLGEGHVGIDELQPIAARRITGRSMRIYGYCETG